MRRSSSSSRRLPLDRKEAVALAGVFRTLAAGFTYPEPPVILDVQGGLHAAEQARRARALSPRLCVHLRRARQLWTGVEPDQLALEYSRSFLGSAPVALREGGYGDGKRFAGQPVDLADVSGFYLAFGFGPTESDASPPDHLGTELEFMSLLYLKLAYALERRRPEQVRITRDAMGRFLQDHLGRWTTALRDGLATAGGAPPYQALADLLARAVEDQCLRLGIDAEPARAGTAVDPVALDDFTCPLSARSPNADPLNEVRPTPGA